MMLCNMNREKKVDTKRYLEKFSNFIQNQNEMFEKL